MNKYNYSVMFKVYGDTNHRYKTVFTIEAEDNNSAKTIGEERWKEQVSKREFLQKANIIKITCRKLETKPRQQKKSSLQKALDALNQYIAEELK